MGLSAYEIALISGGIGIAGTLLGVLCTYYLATKLANTHAAYAARQAEANALREAAAKLRAAFAPAFAQIYLVQNRGNSNYGSTEEAERESISHFVKSHLLAHASAIEEFRPFVASDDRTPYQEAWESYRKLASSYKHSKATDWTANAQEGTALQDRIHAILQFAKT